MHAVCDSILLIQQRNGFLEKRRLNRKDYTASFMYFFHPKSNATTCESAVVEINWSCMQDYIVETMSSNHVTVMLFFSQI